MGMVTARSAQPGPLSPELLALFDLSPIGMVLASLNGQLEVVNQPFCDTLGYSRGELVGRHFGDLTHPDDLARNVELDRDLLAGRLGRFDIEKRYIRKDGNVVFCLLRVGLLRDGSGEATHMIGQVVDISDRIRMEQQLRHEATHDSLTGLPNRSYFNAQLSALMDDSLAGDDYAVLFVDLDGFKLVNDSLGHAAGDALLKQVATRFEEALPRSYLVARHGGDEFVVLVADVQNRNDLRNAALAMLAALERPFSLSGRDFSIGASVGIARGRPYYQSAEEPLRDADVAMYCAKDTGRGSFAIFDEQMRQQVIGRVELEHDLRRALAQGELKLAYQPMISLSSGRVAGFEALVRWQHPSKGLVEPGLFIPVAEETGLIYELGAQVLRMAAGTLSRWAKRGGAVPFVGVNLSGLQLADTSCVREIADTLRRVDLPLGKLHFEITETALMESQEVAPALRDLRELGTRIYVDDFGTGFSSLERLHTLPIDALKIDRGFVSRIDSEGENAEIVRSVSTLAHDLGLDVVAEGIETASQLRISEHSRCELGQGYLFSRPIDEARAYAFFERFAMGSVSRPQIVL